MKKRFLFVLWTLLLGVVPMFAYRDSVDMDSSGDGGLFFALFVFASFIIAFVVGLIRKMFK